MAEGGTLPTIHPPSKRVKSEVWKYFGFQKNAEGMLVEDGFPLCKTCGRRVATKHGNTSNMFAHLRDNHPIQFRDINSINASSSAGSSSAEAIVQPTVKEAFQRQASYGPSSHRAKEIHHAISYYIRSFSQKTELPKMYNSLKEEVGKRIARGKWYAATTDLWTSSGGSGHPYISFTIHYLLDWKLQSNCLETQFFPEDHTADNIREFLDNMLQEWGINKEHLRRRELRSKQEALNVPQRSLIHDVVTRWGSTQKMLQRFIEQQQAVCAVLATDRGAWHLMPKDADIAVIEQVLKILEPLSAFTDALASESRVSLSALKPVLSHIISDILDVKNEDSALTKDLKRLMKSDLESRYTDDAKKVMDLISFVDPRFKGSFSEDLEATVNFCTEEASKLTFQTVSEGLAQTEQTSTASPIPTSENQQQSLATLLNKITSTRQQRAEEGEHSSTLSLNSKIEAEVKVYISVPVIKSETEPLQWWSLHTEELPHLAAVAQKFLCIPATIVAALVFSASGHVLSPLRAKLKPEKVNMLTFFHFNLED
ncbi:putative zinc finger BED domain-containing protein 1-like [Triplophysa rosa]|uniref:Zinc finger BED domain-containing protein 1-like n=1 Tax=Triplophysa rosa TaxID=992332 RepID=A0A9W7WZZ7_TRIRA|nr:putative zinc finger BED domain-containing protein 1-like [Triplophysa rosa]